MVQTASGYLLASGRFVSLCGGSLGTNAARRDVRGLRVAPPSGSWGFTHVCCLGLSLGFPLLRGTIINKSGVCLNCYILAGAGRQEEIPVSTPSHSSHEQSSVSLCLCPYSFL